MYAVEEKCAHKELRSEGIFINWDSRNGSCSSTTALGNEGMYSAEGEREGASVICQEDVRKPKYMKAVTKTGLRRQVCVWG